MDHCTACGAALGIGRFCTNCGHPVATTGNQGGEHAARRTDTAERPRVVAPPVMPPPPPRYATYAEEVVAATRPVEPEPLVDEPRHRGDDRRRSEPGWLPWVAGFVLMGLVAGLGGWLLFGGDDEPTQVAEQSTEPRSPGERTADPTPEPEPEPEPTRTREPDPEPADPPSDLARFTDVSAPPSAPPSQDLRGNAVRYVATNMIDGVPETAWRTPGDATGESVVLRFDAPTVLTEVGLINGYAKIGQDSSGPLDWYAGNRRILEVEWSFDDGTAVTQSLEQTTSMQTIKVKAIETSTVTLRLLEVTEPGEGRSSRDNTAISDVRLFGTTAS